ncbi:MAG: TolB family protein, partial [Actinomycetota bacterium]
FNGGILVVNADGTGEERLSNFGSNPVWSPDGSMVAFDSDGDIFVMNADGTNRTRMTRTDAFEAFPDWQPIPAGGAG